MSEQKTLREKVFECCDNMAAENKKITREVVRKLTGGSDRDLSKYIAEWKAEKEKTAITISEGSEISQQSQESSAINDKSVPNFVPTAGAYSTAPQDDLARIARRGAERAAALLVGEEAVVMHLLENPDQLPLDLRQKVETTRANLTQPINQRQEQYDPEYFARMAVAQFQ